MDTPVVDFKKFAANKAAKADNSNTEHGGSDGDEPAKDDFKRYHIYHRYDDMEESFFEVDGYMGVTPTFIAVSRGPNDIQFVMPIDALKFAEVVDSDFVSEVDLNDDPTSVA